MVHYASHSYPTRQNKSKRKKEVGERERGEEMSPNCEAHWTDFRDIDEEETQNDRKVQQNAEIQMCGR